MSREDLGMSRKDLCALRKYQFVPRDDQNVTHED